MRGIERIDVFFPLTWQAPGEVLKDNVLHEVVGGRHSSLEPARRLDVFHHSDGLHLDVSVKDYVINLALEKTVLVGRQR